MSTKKENYEIATKVMGNLNSAKGFLRTLDADYLTRLANAIDEIVEQKEVEAKAAAAKEKEIAKGRSDLLKQIASFCEEKDLDFDEFIKSEKFTNPNKQNMSDVRNTVKYKAKFKNKVYYWKGSGTMPRIIKAAMMANKYKGKSDMLITGKQMVMEKLDHSYDPKHEAEVEKLVAQWEEKFGEKAEKPQDEVAA